MESFTKLIATLITFMVLASTESAALPHLQVPNTASNIIECVGNQAGAASGIAPHGFPQMPSGNTAASALSTTGKQTVRSNQAGSLKEMCLLSKFATGLLAATVIQPLREDLL